jgi:hypothetical protein
MIFVDYTFQLLADGTIMMDPELTADILNLKDGDLFKAVVVDNQITFIKQPPRQIWEGN